MNYAPDIQQSFVQPPKPDSYFEARNCRGDAIPIPTHFYVTIGAQDISFHKHRHAPVIQYSLESNFKFLVKQWREQVGGDSSLSRITGNINYLKVISLGKQVIPLILKELQKEPAPWFVALRVLTGEEKVGRQHAGDFRRMAD